ncbi:ImmA/IrrE family metallo-endopeptidase [Brevibacillus laterosporus]|uniref:ImmA/IrrE family metallo-endopeptidase n=1 Tax=Brevibacillus laterosporus TaxID=1465 RepID=UPI000CE30288|nr:ImmA/IrrE family metallo-endopeptidase [Brevibacillus laterosporus]PPA85909.1 terminase [Brevibacillus laterosporus]
MDFALYRTTPLEDWITEKYLKNAICSPSDLDINHVAYVFGGEIAYLQTVSHARWIDDGTNVFIVLLDNRLEELEMRSVFFHELCHPLRHCGNQRLLPPSLRGLQEEQANAFQLYAAMPFFMVKELELPLYKKHAIDLLASEFKVSHTFAKKRLEQIERRHFEGRISYEFQRHLQSNKKAKEDLYSHETLRILKQLKRQVDTTPALIK